MRPNNSRNKFYVLSLIEYHEHIFASQLGLAIFVFVVFFWLQRKWNFWMEYNSSMNEPIRDLLHRFEWIDGLREPHYMLVAISLMFPLHFELVCDGRGSRLIPLELTAFDASQNTGSAGSSPPNAPVRIWTCRKSVTHKNNKSKTIQWGSRHKRIQRQCNARWCDKYGDGQKTGYLNMSTTI